MPKISEFFGISIYMYFADHPPPHFHARYAGRTAVFDLESLETIAGDASPRVRRMVAEWAAMHRDELRRVWDQARQNFALDQIAPLE